MDGSVELLEGGLSVKDSTRGLREYLPIGNAEERGSSNLSSSIIVRAD